jgi:Rrf2 family transcriptional regulator, cysteine metabolism repressor
MRINTRVRYAIRMMADMAKHGHGEPVALRDVAARQNLPKMYLSQLTAPLKSAALIKSFWGNRGGYTLNRPATEISLLEIIEAVEGPIALLDCVQDPRRCERSDFCEAIGVWRTINETLVATLEHYSLADLVRKSRPVVRTADLCVIGQAQEEVLHDSHNPIHATSGSRHQRKVHPAPKG